MKTQSARRRLALVSLGAVITTVSSSLAAAPGPGPAAPPDALDALKNSLGATDEQWNSLKPLIQKVSDERTQAQFGNGPRGGFGARGPGGAGFGGGAAPGAGGGPAAGPGGGPAAGGGGGRGGARLTPEQLAALPEPKYDPNRPKPAQGEDARDPETLLTPPPGLMIGRRNNFWDRPDGRTNAPGTGLYRWASTGHFSNYDESKTGDWKKTIPNALVTNAGKPVTDAETWWKVRRPEIIEAAEEWVYGKVPPNVPKVKWTATRTLNGNTIQVAATGQFVNADGTPWQAPSFGGGGGAPAGPGASIIPAAPDASMNLPANPLAAFLPRQNDGLTAFGGGGPGGGGGGGFGGGGRGGRGPGGGGLTCTYTIPANAPGAVPLISGGNQQQVMAMGFGVVNFGGNAPNVHTGKPDDWGSNRQTSWVLSQCLDYLETDPSVDAHQVALTGHSIGGKIALLRAVFDQRVGLVFASCSGEGGASMSRHDWGETIDDTSQLAAGEYCQNFQKWRANWANMPIDSNSLIAALAPRPLFVSGGTDDQWSDPVGVFWAAYYAAPVYKLLGVNDWTRDPALPADPTVPKLLGDAQYKYTAPPEPNTFVGEQLVMYDHIGGHITTQQETAKYHEMIQKYFKVKPFPADYKPAPPTRAGELTWVAMLGGMLSARREHVAGWPRFK